jgi:hypothetical protein
MKIIKTQKERGYKAFQVRLPKECWLTIKIAALEQERSMADIILECVRKYMSKLDYKKMDYNLISDDTNVE